VHDVAVVKKPVQDSSCKDFVSGKHLRPIPYAFVRRYDRAGAFVPGADDLEKQMGIAFVQGLEPEFIKREPYRCLPLNYWIRLRPGVGL
jgi:hypothetical protein